jgi:transcriptional regulator with XRE-family HTH domain
MTELGKRVRQRRRALDLTQEQLAELTGSPQFHISAIERGRVKEVTSLTLRRLAPALRVSADWLLELTDDLEDERLPADAALVEA